MKVTYGGMTVIETAKCRNLGRRACSVGVKLVLEPSASILEFKGVIRPPFLEAFSSSDYKRSEPDVSRTALHSG